jgi:predicted ATPase
VGRIAIRLLGGFEAFVDGRPADTGWRLRKARDLVKLLALAHGHRSHREQVMDALWPDRQLAAAANNLNQVVHVARRVLGRGAILVQGELLELVADVDVDAFEDAAAGARRSRSPGAYASALELYRGELLPENRYEDWCAERREYLARLRDTLADELAELGGARPSLRELRPDASSFIGREHELAELRALLERTRLLTLTGAGGAGKTRLAVELARKSEADYPDGQALAGLADIAQSRLVSAAVAAALEVRPLPGQDVVDALVDFLRARSLLLVLDNCEHVLRGAAELVEALLRNCRLLTVVTTSREPLRLAPEVVFRVPSLSIPDPELTLGVDELARFDAVKLFVDRASAAAPSFRLDDANALDVARICFRLDGLPLAVELAAARLGALEPAALAARLDDRFRLLRAGSPTAPTRQQTLAATLQWSHDLLGEDEAVLYRRLGVFSGGFSLEAVEEVCSGSGIERGEVADLFARLVEKSLVTVEMREGRWRYRLLETIRVDARQRLDAAGESDVIASRHATWALELAESSAGAAALDRDEANLSAALDTLLDSDPERALRLCLALWRFWLRRVDFAEAARRFDSALDRVPTTSPLRAAGILAASGIDVRAGLMARGKQRTLESLEIARETDDRAGEWRALHRLGALGLTPGPDEDAQEWLSKAIALARKEGFAAREAIGVYSLGVAAWLAGDLAQAEELVLASLEALRALPASAEPIPSPINIAETLKVHDDGRITIVFEDTRHALFEIGVEKAVGYVLANLAGVIRTRGDLDRARRLLEEAAARFDREDDEWGRADLLIRRAYLELDAGGAAEAERLFRRALDLRRRLHDRRGSALALSGLGLAALARGDYDDADRQLADACAIFRRGGDRWGLVGALWRTADLGIARGRLDDAEAVLEEARAIVGETGSRRWLASTLAGLAEVALLRGELEDALRLLGEAQARLAEQPETAFAAAVDARLAALQAMR